MASLCPASYLKGTRLNNITALVPPPHPGLPCVPRTPTLAVPRAPSVSSNNTDSLVFDSIV